MELSRLSSNVISRRKIKTEKVRFRKDVVICLEVTPDLEFSSWPISVVLLSPDKGNKNGQDLIVVFRECLETQHVKGCVLRADAIMDNLPVAFGAALLIHIKLLEFTYKFRNREVEVAMTIQSGTREYCFSGSISQDKVPNLEQEFMQLEV